MKKDSINFRGGNILFNDLYLLFRNSSIDPDYLKEDILLIGYANKTLDVGFYGSNNLVIRIIENENWESPIFIKAIKNITKETVYQEINNAINIILT